MKLMWRIDSALFPPASECLGVGICAGTVPTKFAAALVETPEMEAANKARTFLGRLGTAEDMAAAVAYLASDDASYVTGETIVVAGGMHSRL